MGCCATANFSNLPAQFFQKFRIYGNFRRLAQGSQEEADSQFIRTVEICAVVKLARGSQAILFDRTPGSCGKRISVGSSPRFLSWNTSIFLQFR
jgi:hypothetical protein